MISNAPDSHSDLSSPCIRFSCNMALTTLAAKRGMRALSHQAAAPALPAQCGRASCWGTTGMRAVKVKCTKEPIIAQHSFSRHVVWGNPLPSVNICLFIGFCIWKCIVLTITCITCLVAYTWSPDRPLYIRMPCKHCQLLYRQHTRAHTTMNRCDVFASSRIFCRIPKAACQQRDTPLLFLLRQIRLFNLKYIPYIILTHSVHLRITLFETLPTF